MVSLKKNKMRYNVPNSHLTTVEDKNVKHVLVEHTFAHTKTNTNRGILHAKKLEYTSV
jgi:hypothetical protein